MSVAFYPRKVHEIFNSLLTLVLKDQEGIDYDSVIPTSVRFMPIGILFIVWFARTDYGAEIKKDTCQKSVCLEGHGALKT